MKLQDDNLEELRYSLAFWASTTVFIISMAPIAFLFFMTDEASVFLGLGAVAYLAAIAHFATSKLLRFYAIVHGAEVVKEAEQDTERKYPQEFK